MRIVVNAIAASAGGALTILNSLHQYANEVDEAHDWVFLLGGELLAESDQVCVLVLPAVKASWLRRLDFDFVRGRRVIRSLRPDVVLSLQNTMTFGVDCPQVVYVHQALPFQRSPSYSLLKREERRLGIYQHLIGRVIKQSIRRADHVVVQTEWIRAAILDALTIPEERVDVVPPDTEDLTNYRNSDGYSYRSFVYPANDYIYKNHECVYAACGLLRERGITDFSVAVTIDQAADPNVEAIGLVPRDHLLGLLSRSTLIFPSYVETFGLPIAEARALGSITLVADLPYAQEVTAGYANAYRFDPKSPDQLASLMAQVIAGDIVRQPSSALGPQTSTWPKVLAILESLGQRTH